MAAGRKIKGAAWVHLALALGSGLLVTASCAPEEPVRPNLLLVTIDTLRADALGCYGGDEGARTPHLDALAREGSRFTDVTSAISWTLPSLATLMTGQHAAVHGAIDDRHGLDDSLPVLAELASRAGYATHGIGSHIFLGERYGLQRGFDTYDEELAPSYQERRLAHRQVTSPALVEKARAWIEERSAEGSPWICWVHLFDPHNEYRTHEGFPVGDEPRDLYGGEVSFTDHHLGSLLQWMREAGLRESTLVAVMSDHGEEFGEHGGRLHRRTLFEEVVHVPLILEGPGIPSGVVTESAGLVDVMPTLMDLLALAKPEQLRGRSLLPALHGAALDPRPAIAELEGPRPQRSLRLGPWKLIGSPLEDFWFLYDLENDPGEQQNVAKEHPELVLELRSLLDAELRGDRLGQHVELTEDDLQHLEALGYGGE